MSQAVTKELNELADDAFLAEHFCHGQNQVRCCRAFAEFAGQFESDDIRDQHGNWLTQHRSLGLDAADAPAENTQAVDHCCV